MKFKKTFTVIAAAAVFSILVLSGSLTSLFTAQQEIISRFKIGVLMQEQGEPTVSNGTLIYNGSEQALGTVTPGTGAGADVQYSIDGKIFSTTIPTGLNAGTYIVYYKIAGDSSHTEKKGSYTQIISKKAPTLTLSSSSGTMSSSAADVVTYTYDGDGAITVASSNSDIAEAVIDAEANTITITGKGLSAQSPVIITVSASEGINFNAASVTYSMTIVDKNTPADLSSRNISAYKSDATGFQRSYTAPSSADKATVISTSGNPIYVWEDSDKVVNVYSESKKIYFPENSSSFFYDWNNLKFIDLSGFDLSKVNNIDYMFVPGNSTSAMVNALTTIYAFYPISESAQGDSVFGSKTDSDSTTKRCNNLVGGQGTRCWIQGTWRDPSKYIFSHVYARIDDPNYQSHKGLFTLSKKFNTWNIKFDANGGSGSMDKEDFSYTDSKSLTQNTFANNDETAAFAGWNTRKDGGGVAFRDGQNISIYNFIRMEPSQLYDIFTIDKDNPSCTLYAQWKYGGAFKVVFDANGGSGTMDSESFDGTAGRSLVKNTILPYDNEHIFTGWNTKADGTGKSFEDEAYLTSADQNSKLINGERVLKLYAQWGKYEGSSQMENFTNLHLIQPTAKKVERSYISPSKTISTTEIQTADSSIPVYAWEAADGTLEIYSRAKTIYFPEDGELFDNYTKLESADLSGFSFSKTTSLTGMFMNCTSLKNVNFADADTSAVTSIASIFRACNSIESIDISSFNTSHVTNMYGCFYGCENLKTIYASGRFTTDSVTNSDCMFEDCASLVGASGTKYNGNIKDKTYARIDKASTPGYFSFKPVRFTVKFNANNGEGEMQNQTLPGTEESLDANAFTPPALTSCSFEGWNTKADGAGKSFTDKQGITSADVEDYFTYDESDMPYVVLYASWFKPAYAHTSNVNDNGSTNNPSYPKGAETVVVELPGADKLHVKIYCSFGKSDNAVMRIWEGNHPDRHVNGSYSDKAYSPGSSTDETMMVNAKMTEYDIDGDSVTFGFYSSSGGHAYGYYAVVTGTCYKRFPFTVKFDANKGSGSMGNQSYAYTEKKALLANAFKAPNSRLIFYGWNTKSDGTGISFSDSEKITSFSKKVHQYFSSADSSDASMTLYAHWKFPVKYSHTANINDSGAASGTYASRLDTNDVITITGASKLHVKLYYSTENPNYDWVCVWAGSHPDYKASRNYNSSKLGTESGKIGGGKEKTMAKASVLEGDINGNSVTFGFKSDSSGAYYGYYAVVTDASDSASAKALTIFGSWDD